MNLILNSSLFASSAFLIPSVKVLGVSFESNLKQVTSSSNWFLMPKLVKFYYSSIPFGFFNSS